MRAWILVGGLAASAAIAGLFASTGCGGGTDTIDTNTSTGTGATGAGGTTSHGGTGGVGALGGGGAGGEECVPELEELCDGVDNTCDGVVDENCDCIEGETQPCYTGDPLLVGVGLCAEGEQICDIHGVFGDECVGEVLPSADICDGEDNDCDHGIDEDLGTVTCGLGNCQVTVEACVGGQPTPCVPGNPAVEVCDGDDDDCDGIPDNGCACVNGQTTPCYGGSLATRGVGECKDGLSTCMAGQYGACVGDTQPSNETCDGLDNDCDGTPDDGDPGGGTTCPTGVPGVCAPGIWHCSNGGLVCQQTVFPSAETCDNKDNDCNGQTDEGNPGGGGGCATGNLGECAIGTWTCTTGALVCVQNQPSSTEVCDNKDNNCNGQTDEGNPGGGGACATGQLGVCAAGTFQCQTGNLNCVQTTQAGAEICDAMDNDCDGATDENDPGGGSACTTGQPGICSAGTRHCTGGALSCTANATPITEVCGNALDDDCNGTVDNGCCTSSIIDGGFEAGPPWPAWAQTSTTFGTPLCSVASCCSATPQVWCYPHAGTYWSWFGGVGGAVEDATLTQSVVIPVGATSMTFWLMIPGCASAGTDYMRVTIDGTQVFNVTRTDPSCDSYVWVQKSINIAAYANGGSHNIVLLSHTAGSGSASDNVTNFMVDDVAINTCIP